MKLKKQVYNAILDQMLPFFSVVACIIRHNRQLKNSAKMKFNV
jgi:hypothetical protein